MCRRLARQRMAPLLALLVALLATPPRAEAQTTPAEPGEIAAPLPPTAAPFEAPPIATSPNVAPPIAASPTVAPAPVAAPPSAPLPLVEQTILEPPVFEPVVRPRLSLAAGMGATFDAAGFPGGTHAIPAFFAVGGFGDGLGGFDLGAFASSASGRFHGVDASGVSDNPVDRLALDAFGVLRPAARLARGDDRYRMRVLRTAAAELGLGVEREGRATGSGRRLALHAGARVELPLTRAGEASELRLRLAVRRAIGLYTPEIAGVTPVDVTKVGDTTEVYAALAVVF